MKLNLVQRVILICYGIASLLIAIDCSADPGIASLIYWLGATVATTAILFAFQNHKS
jgi:hypothetical protein